MTVNIIYIKKNYLSTFHDRFIGIQTAGGGFPPGISYMGRFMFYFSKLLSKNYKLDLKHRFIFEIIQV